MNARDRKSRELPEEPEELGPLTSDAIAGSLRITQRRYGHRYSIDDVLTAQVAAEAQPQAQRCLELGSGIGSVLLMLCYKLPHATFLAIEAQRNSFRLLTDNVRQNGLDGRVTARHGDLRELVTPALGQFDLITGTPPYVAPGHATPSSDAQRAFARQEWRGGVEDYVTAGSRVLGAQGRLVVCADARNPLRVEQAALRNNLVNMRRIDVFPRAGRPPLFSVFCLARPSSAAQEAARVEAFIARDATGRRTEAYHALREYFGMARPTHEADSP
ncbi:MAG TPA: methyltransferase [Polyangiales bacterium]|nr:methyltransferase [Polyangiales bacterium]